MSGGCVALLIGVVALLASVGGGLLRARRWRNRREVIGRIAKRHMRGIYGGYDGI